MKAIKCENCGAIGLKIEKEYWVCEYCGSKFLVAKEDWAACTDVAGVFSENKQPQAQSKISLSDDIANLLRKCDTDRRNACKYANLILDIDPDNTEALKYLN